MLASSLMMVGLTNRVEERIQSEVRGGHVSYT
jgi:hypothetical protein